MARQYNSPMSHHWNSVAEQDMPLGGSRIGVMPALNRHAMSRVADSFASICGRRCKQAPPSRSSAPGANTGRKAMRVLAATLISLVSSAAAAQECKTCSMADACIKAYLKATSEAQTATKQAIRDWKQNLDRKASAELASRGTLALQDTMETQVRSELERLKECLAKIR
jgi:hypothetical protein